VPAHRRHLAIAHVLVEEVAAFAPTMRLAALLEAAGVPRLNPLRAVVTSADKLATHAVWAGPDLPQPATVPLDAVERWPRPGRPMVLKPALGDGARLAAPDQPDEQGEAAGKGGEGPEADVDAEDALVGPVHVLELDPAARSRRL
jgi:hypothetical protein